MRRELKDKKQESQYHMTTLKSYLVTLAVLASAPTFTLAENTWTFFEGWMVSNTDCITSSGATPCYFFEQGQSFTEDQLMGSDTWDTMLSAIPSLGSFIVRDGQTVTFTENVIIPITL